MYHVMARGHEKGEVFRDDRDRRRFLAFLADVRVRHAWLIHAFCLMGNHFHLLLETPGPSLSAGMRDLNGRYAQWFNHLHDRKGHLFEDRFRAIVVEKYSYLLELTRYIVLNPVRSGLVQRPEEYTWSSFSATAGLRQAPAWLEVDWTLSQFAPTKRSAQEAYWRFVSEGLEGGRPELPIRGGLYLASEEFVRILRPTRRHAANDRQIPAPQRRPLTQGLGVIRRVVARRYQLSDEALSGTRCGEAKYAALWLARRLSGLSCEEIGREFAVTASRVSQAVKQVDEGRLRHLRPALDGLARQLENQAPSGKNC